MTVGISRGYEPGRVLLILPTTDIGRPGDDLGCIVQEGICTEEFVESFGLVEAGNFLVLY